MRLAKGAVGMTIERSFTYAVMQSLTACTTSKNVSRFDSAKSSDVEDKSGAGDILSPNETMTGRSSRRGSDSYPPSSETPLLLALLSAP